MSDVNTIMNRTGVDELALTSTGINGRLAEEVNGWARGEKGTCEVTSSLIH